MELPNEVITQIINLVHPADIESLVLCSKTISTLAKKALLRHTELKRKYSILKLKDDAWVDGQIRIPYEGNLVTSESIDYELISPSRVGVWRLEEGILKFTHDGLPRTG